jgi:hypothetical protein
MGIERLDEADAPAAGREQASERGRGADGDPAIAPETRDQVTYRAEYRATVDAAYGATSASWDAAALELREAWESHEARWSLPDDSSLPRRRLEPEANAEVERGCGRIREVGENVITPAMRAIEAEDPGRHLIGLDHRLKGEDRIKEKVADAVRYRGRTPEEALGTIKDAIRFTLGYSEERYVNGVRADCERLQSQGFEPFDLVNSWQAEEYRGINSRWREPESGLLFEVQFHTWASFEAKQLTHAAYERLRNPATSDSERDELQEFQRKASAEIPIPPSVTDIEDYSPEKRDG